MEIKYDRVTMYRVIKKLEEQNLIYRVPDFKGTAKYMLYSSYAETGANHPERVHFNCKVCNSIFCLNQIIFPAINLPDEYVIIPVNIVMVGICPDCRN
jgi:Fur family transcriptional regulator, ferric uptake regulator